MSKPLTGRRGFTLVELMITIVVIAVLAAVSVTSYIGLRERARDTRRLSDVRTITQALDVYRAKFGQYPAHQTASGIWEATLNYSDNFLNSLVTSGILQKVPVDPVNNPTHYYRYYRYTAGSHGCDASRGAFYVLQVRTSESTVLKNASPGHSCPDRNWTSEMPDGYTVAGFENY